MSALPPKADIRRPKSLKPRVVAYKKSATNRRAIVALVEHDRSVRSLHVLIHIR